MNTAKVAIGAAAVVLSSPAWAGFSVDENTGEAHYTYDVLMPQARGRYQPSLTLMYGSSNLTDSGYGFGWALSGDWIETQQLASGSWRGVYVHNGSRRPLLYSPARGGWVPEVRDGSASPLTVTQFGCTTSTGYDAEGNQYQFVSISSASGVGCTGIQYLWTVTDLDGNTTNFQWTFYPQSYPTLVSDVGVPPDHYLTQITYNLYDSGGTNRRVAFGDPYATSIDLQYSVVAAVGTTPASVTLNNVRVTNQGNTLRRYEFAYGFSSNPYQSTPTSLRVLQSITEHGQESGVTFAPTSFAYSSAIPNTIVTPTGATYNVEYLLFRPESTVIRAVTSVKITGPGIDTSTTAKPIRFFYQAWVPSTTSWFDQTKEMIGYSQSYVLNTASNTVRMTTWETTAHAFRGVAAQVEWGPATNTAVTPPAYSVYQREVSEHTSVSLTGTCVAPTAPASQSTAGSAQDYAGVPSDFYPAIAFTSRRRSATFDSGTEFAREVAIACNQLDIYGNVRQRHVDPDVARAGDDFYQNTTFVIASAPTSPCKSCVATETRTADAQQTNLLASTRYTYDATTWNVSAIWKATDPSVEARLTTFTYNPNGAVASKVDSSDVDAISTVFTYDAVQLRPTRVDSQQGGKTLTTEITYDAYGRQVFVRGPYLGTPDTGQAIGAAYDELDRPIAIARGPISGITVVAGIAAFQYSDFRASAPLAPASVTSFAFAVPVSYTLNSPPQTSDARQTITYFDALGRKIQVRERMGGASSAITSITQNLAVFRVSGVIYDSAGRIAAEIEPFYSSSGAFLDYRTAALDDVIPTNGGGLSTALHARLHTYDDKSREVCSAYAFVPSRGIVPAAPTSCQSNFTETAGYVRATATCYRAATEKTPAMLAVKTIEPQLTASGAPNCASSPRGPESFFDGSGTLREARDIDGNVMQYTLDLNRNVTGFVRSTSDGASSVAVSLSYDMAGRVKHRTDPDIGTYDYSYFDSGRLRRMTLAARPLGGGISGSNYLDLSYDMGRLATRNACSAQASGGVTSWSCAPDTYVYDSPYVAGAYSFVAGRLAYAQNANSTIAFGYSPEGAILVRDQMLKGLSGVFSTTIIRGRWEHTTVRTASRRVR